MDMVIISINAPYEGLKAKVKLNDPNVAHCLNAQSFMHMSVVIVMKSYIIFELFS